MPHPRPKKFSCSISTLRHVLDHMYIEDEHEIGPEAYGCIRHT